MLKKINQIDEFIARSIGFQITGKIGDEVHFPLMKDYNILIKQRNNVITFFDNSLENNLLLSVAAFELFNIDKSYLEEIYQAFSLFKEIHNPEYYSIKFKIDTYSQYYINFKKDNDNMYCILYATKKERESQSPGEDAIKDNVVYVHEIWEVELGEEFRKKLFFKT